ncbi:DUF2939 domain-containing protein [Candidatus Halobeggiatoa sp. HSG11]|nr:DUF2939 domain-containing protein [Candidatus Halobeggiatoa sp. HSG11]
MRLLSSLIFFAFVAFVAWPYVHIYQISAAIINNDQSALEELVDFESVNKTHKQNIEWKTNNMVESSGGLLPDSMRGGAEAIAGALGNLAAETTAVDAKRIIELLRTMEGSPWEQLTFAFFESPNTFIVRLGKLGRNPIHIRMTMQGWYWRVTAVYG